MQQDTITLAGRTYTRVRDLTQVPARARLMKNHPNHTTSFLTVLTPYGEHGELRETGVLCHLDQHDGGWNTVLTPRQLDDATVWMEEA